MMRLLPPLVLCLVAACSSSPPPPPASSASPPDPTGWEGFYPRSMVTDAWLTQRGIPLRASAVHASRSRVAKLVIADGERRAPRSLLDQMERHDCGTATDRAWNAERCAALAARECEGETCRYEHFGNCSGLLAGEGRLVTAAHCVSGLLADASRAARSVVVVPDGEGGVGRRLPLGAIRAGKRDFSHHWVAIDEEVPLDVASIELDLDDLDPVATGPVPGVGEVVFIAGFPRVEGRAEAAMRAAGYPAVAGTPSVGFGRIADRNEAGAPLCSVDGNQEHWALRAPCTDGEVEFEGEATWRGDILHAPFLATYDTINGYSGGPVFDQAGRWVGINSTLTGRIDPQQAYDPDTRAVVTAVAPALARLAETPAEAPSAGPRAPLRVGEPRDPLRQGEVLTTIEGGGLRAPWPVPLWLPLEPEGYDKCSVMTTLDAATMSPHHIYLAQDNLFCSKGGRECRLLDVRTRQLTTPPGGCIHGAMSQTSHIDELRPGWYRVISYAEGCVVASIVEYSAERGQVDHLEVDLGYGLYDFVVTPGEGGDASFVIETACPLPRGCDLQTAEGRPTARWRWSPGQVPTPLAG